MTRMLHKPGKKSVTDINQTRPPESDSEARYHQLFEDCPVGILDEDYSEVKVFLDSLDCENTPQLKQYFRNNPEMLKQVIGSVRVTDVNAATLKAYKFSSKDEFMEDHKDFDDWYDEDWAEFYIEELVALYTGDLPYHREYT